MTPSAPDRGSKEPDPAPDEHDQSTTDEQDQNQPAGQQHQPRRSRARVWLLLAGVALLCYALDQGTKALALAKLQPYDPSPPSFLSGLVKFRLVFNSGAAFSFGTNSTIVFTVLAMAALVGCLVFVVPRVRTLAAGAVTGLALAGIAGNLTDRIFRAPGNLRGHVIDFIALPNFAVFNVADMCITATALLVILGSLRAGLAESRAAKQAAQGGDQDSESSASAAPPADGRS